MYKFKANDWIIYEIIYEKLRNILITSNIRIDWCIAAVLDENIGFEDTGELLGSVGLSSFYTRITLRIYFRCSSRIKAMHERF